MKAKAKAVLMLSAAVALTALSACSVQWGEKRSLSLTPVGTLNYWFPAPPVQTVTNTAPAR